MVDLTSTSDDSGSSCPGGLKKGIVFQDIKAEGRRDGIKVVLDADGNVKVDVRQVEDIGIEDVEYDSDGEIIEDMN
jgi:hypothetical protein